jgi:hypothetical protein
MYSTKFKILKRMLCLGIIGWAGSKFYVLYLDYNSIDSCGNEYVLDLT